MKGKLFAETLRQCIRIFGADLRLLIRGEMVGDSIARRGCRVEKPLDICRLGRLQDGKCAVHIGMKIVLRSLNGWNDVSECREMEDPVRTGKKRRDSRSIANIHLNHGKACISLVMCKVLTPSRRAVINDNDLMPLCKKPVYHVRPDKAAPSRYD